MRQLREFRAGMEAYLREGPLVVCYLDGLGYEMYRWAAGRLPLFMEKEFLVEPVQSVEPPLTNGAMATMLTGVDPGTHKITSHGHRRLTLPTIFESYGGRSLLLEGDMRILDLKKRAILHTARRGKSGDEWIWEDVHRGLEKGYPFIFAHFHQIDDAGHLYGPYSREVLEEIEQADKQIKNLTEHYETGILLISDHGMYQGEEGGLHAVTNEKSRPGARTGEELYAIWGERRKEQGR